MKAYEVRNLKWEYFPKERIAQIPATHQFMGKLYVSQKDLDNFLQNTFEEIDEKVGASRSIIYILQENNTDFFENRNILFRQQAMEKSNKKFIQLMSSLKLPVIEENKNSLQDCIDLYRSLSDAEKEKFLATVTTEKKPE